MFNKFQQWIINPYLWLIFSSFVVLLPLLLLGEPRFYGDDYNVYQVIEKYSLPGAIMHWLNEYGWSYRPVGITFLYTYYAVFFDSPFLLYLGYQLCYLALSIFLYREVFKLTGNVSLGVFVALFFLFFPFNPTAYWQVSSLMMVVATLLTIILIRYLLRSSQEGSYNHFFFLSICWLLLLFSYEQLLGLAAVIGVCIILGSYSGDWVKAIKKSSIFVAILGAVSLVFLLAYFSSESNPKLVSLKILNQAETVVEVPNNTLKEKVVSAKAPVGKWHHFLARVEKGANFLLNSISYSLHSLFASGMVGYIMILAVLLLGGGVFLLPIEWPLATRQAAWLYLFLGGLWVVITLAPFFLYNKVHIPPYTLMLPSVGLGIALFGLFQLVASVFPGMYAKWMAKALLFCAVTTFPLMQYGYYFGLQEELEYWRYIAGEVKEKEILEVDNVITLSEVRNKNNQHIFWLESAVGLRYISAHLNKSVKKIIRQGNQLSLVLEKN